MLLIEMLCGTLSASTQQGENLYTQGELQEVVLEQLPNGAYLRPSDIDVVADGCIVDSAMTQRQKNAVREWGYRLRPYVDQEGHTWKTTFNVDGVPFACSFTPSFTLREIARQIVLKNPDTFGITSIRFVDIDGKSIEGLSPKEVLSGTMDASSPPQSILDVSVGYIALHLLLKRCPDASGIPGEELFNHVRIRTCSDD